MTVANPESLSLTGKIPVNTKIFPPARNQQKCTRWFPLVHRAGALTRNDKCVHRLLVVDNVDLQSVFAL